MDSEDNREQTQQNNHIADDSLKTAYDCYNRLYLATVRNEAALRQKYKLRRTASLALLIAIAGGAALGFGYGAGSSLATEYWIPRMSSDKDALKEYSYSVGYVSTEQSGIYSYSDVIEMVEPSVVRVSTSRRVPGGYRFNKTSSAGTGMFFHETENKYYIVTNAHVVMGADIVQVAVHGSDNLTVVTVEGADTASDVAILSLDKTDAFKNGITSVSLAVLGDSNRLRAGDEVIAIGNAMDHGITSTTGIISALERVIVVDGAGYSVLQTNAAINHGNSGGPLVLLDGSIIGMNTAKIKQEDVEGIGYSIPTNTLIPVIEALMRGEQ